MQSLNFAPRRSMADSVDDNQSRYVPSSIYSGPGPAEEYPLPPQPAYPPHRFNGLNSSNGSNGIPQIYQSVQTNPYAQPQRITRLRNSNLLNMNDPIVIHLLAETALSDSKDFEVLSFEELERLKKERMVLRNRIEATKRKIALECKLRDAAQSLNRLYSDSKGSLDMKEKIEPGHNRNFTGSRSSNNEALSRAHNEYQSSSQRIDDLTHELKVMEMRLEDIQRRILEHTAGILQFTHKGLKKNLRKNDLPRSPESMISPGHNGVSGLDQSDEFDERSLYPVPDYVHDFVQSNPVTPIMAPNRKANQDTQVLEDLIVGLQDLSARMHDMVRQFNPFEDLTPPPITEHNTKDEGHGPHAQNQLGYISNALDAITVAQRQMLEDSENVNDRIHKVLEKTNSVSRSPIIIQDEPRGTDLASQLAFSTRVLEQLHIHVETLVEHKDILTRQIQQQRELNSKSDAQRDAQISDLTEELQETKRNQEMAEREAKEFQSQISMLIEQLDRSKHDAMLMEQQRSMDENKALKAEREARKSAEAELLANIEAKQQENVQLQADLSKMRNDFEIRSQQHIQQMNDLSSAKDETSIQLERHQAESEKTLEQMAALQTELTIVKAELDGAYGTRAQRAADVSLNPAIQKEIDSLSSRNAQLQKELKETIEDYEQMTKASIEFEKERDQLESSIDTLREKSESLESQLNEEKLKWLGLKTQPQADTTSTMILKNEFKKMMRDARAENIKVLRAEQEERRKLEAIIRNLRKEAGLATPSKSTTGSLLTAEPMTPSASR